MVTRNFTFILYNTGQKHQHRIYKIKKTKLPNDHLYQHVINFSYCAYSMDAFNAKSKWGTWLVGTVSLHWDESGIVHAKGFTGLQ